MKQIRKVTIKDAKILTAAELNDLHFVSDHSKLADKSKGYK